jgi:hypothetical protein
MVGMSARAPTFVCTFKVVTECPQTTTCNSYLGLGVWDWDDEPN